MKDHRHIRFCRGLSPDPERQASTHELRQLQQLLGRAAFWAADRSLDDLAIALRHSCPVVSVWHYEQLIGFARATSDGIYRATIWDVVIDPAYRGQGLGSNLVETVLAHPHMNRVERVYLMTTHHQSFYEGIGFERNSTSTMVLHQQGKLPIVPHLGAEIQVSSKSSMG